MHMADALLSPAVGGTMWAASGVTIAYCCRKLRRSADDGMVPLMGVLGAFVFTAQMINFTIPATGSSGHIGGGLLLAVLLGPYAAFLVTASVLAIQALFFADGGLLALGANIINLGFFPCFVAYPLIYRPLVGSNPTAGRIIFASIAAALVGLQLGASGVLLETVASGISALPLSNFALLMLPIHMAIGLVEGLVTAAVLNFVRQADPSLLRFAVPGRSEGLAMRRVLVGLLVAAMLIGGLVAWFASTRPDGLEWSIAGVVGSEALSESGAQGKIKRTLAELQEGLAFLPDYGFPALSALSKEANLTERESKPQAVWPAVDPGTSTAGLVGGLLTLVFAGLTGLALRLGRNRSRPACVKV